MGPEAHMGVYGIRLQPPVTIVNTEKDSNIMSFSGIVSQDFNLIIYWKTVRHPKISWLTRLEATDESIDSLADAPEMYLPSPVYCGMRSDLLSSKCS